MIFHISIFTYVCACVCMCVCVCVCKNVCKCEKMKNTRDSEDDFIYSWFICQCCYFVWPVNICLHTAICFQVTNHNLYWTVIPSSNYSSKIISAHIYDIKCFTLILMLIKEIHCTIDRTITGIITPSQMEQVIIAMKVYSTLPRSPKRGLAISWCLVLLPTAVFWEDLYSNSDYMEEHFLGIVLFL